MSTGHQAADNVVDELQAVIRLLHASLFVGPLTNDQHQGLRALPGIREQVIELGHHLRGLQDDLAEEIRRSMRLEDRYNRDVEGLNNEGDAVGGEPACGMRHLSERYRQLVSALNDLIDDPDVSSNQFEQAVIDLVRPPDRGADQLAADGYSNH